METQGRNLKNYGIFMSPMTTTNSLQKKLFLQADEAPDGTPTLWTKGSNVWEYTVANTPLRLTQKAAASTGPAAGGPRSEDSDSDSESASLARTACSNASTISRFSSSTVKLFFGRLRARTPPFWQGGGREMMSVSDAMSRRTSSLEKSSTKTLLRRSSVSSQAPCSVKTYQGEGTLGNAKMTTYRILNVFVHVCHHHMYRYLHLWVRSEIEVAARYVVVKILESHVQLFQGGVRLKNLFERVFGSIRDVDTDIEVRRAYDLRSNDELCSPQRNDKTRKGHFRDSPLIPWKLPRP